MADPQIAIQIHEVAKALGKVADAIGYGLIWAAMIRGVMNK